MARTMASHPNFMRMCGSGKGIDRFLTFFFFFEARYLNPTREVKYIKRNSHPDKTDNRGYQLPK